MTASTANDGDGPFDSTFNLVTAVVAAAVFLFGLLAAWTGYQDEGQLPVLGTELSIIEGMVLLTFTTAVAVVALWIALYMESGFGETTAGHAGEAAEPDEAEAES